MMKRAITWLVLLLAVVGSLGAVVVPGGLKASVYVDDYSDVYLADGKTDATAAILLCLQCSGKAVLSPGDYLISEAASLTMPDGTTLSGAGMGISRLVGTVGEAGVILRAGTNCTVRDLSVVGSDESGDTASRPATGKDNVLYERVEFTDCPTGSETSSDSGTMDNLTYRSCKFNSCGTLAFRTNAADVDGALIDCVIVDCPVGIQFDGSPVGWTVRGCSITSATTCVNLNSAINTSISECSLSGTTSIQLGTGASCAIGENYYASDEILPSDVANLQTSLRGVYYGSAEPTVGTWRAGDRVTNTAAGSGTVTPVEWYCTGGGSPGTWTALYRGVSIVTGTATWNPGTINAGASETTNVTIAGGVLGSVAVAGHSQALPDGWLLSAYVTSSTNAKVVLFNATGSNADPADSGTLTVRVFQ